MYFDRELGRTLYDQSTQTNAETPLKQNKQKPIQERHDPKRQLSKLWHGCVTQ